MSQHPPERLPSRSGATVTGPIVFVVVVLALAGIVVRLILVSRRSRRLRQE